MQYINSKCGFLVLSALSPKRKVLRIRVKTLENRIWEMAVISACTLHNSATRQANCNHALGQGYGRICKWYGVYHYIKKLKITLYYTRPPSPVLCINFVKNVQTAIFKHFLQVLPLFSLKTPNDFNTIWD